MLTKEISRVRLDRAIADLDLEGKIVLAFDFDELVVPTNLTKEVATEVGPLVDAEVIGRLGSCSLEGITYLTGLLNGVDFRRYQTTIEEAAERTPWVEGFREAIVELRFQYSVIFISSGHKAICQAKLREIDFNPRNVLSGDLQVEQGIIKGPSLIVTDQDKGYIVDVLKDGYHVIAVGHSLGDKPMLDAANLGIGVNPVPSDLAQVNVGSAKEMVKAITDYVGQR